MVPEYAPEEQQVDWREWRVVRKVQDVGNCGSTYAFAAASAAESSYAIKTGVLHDLSEQYLLDCD